MMMIKTKPHHLAALVVAALSTSNFDNFASALDDRGRGLRGNANAIANGSIVIRGGELSIDGNHFNYKQQQRNLNLKKKQPATTGQVRLKVFFVRHSHQIEIYSDSNSNDFLLTTADGGVGRRSRRGGERSVLGRRARLLG
jgi:hypothetical protein